MPPRTTPGILPRAHETSILAYWRAISLLISAPLLRAPLLSSGIRSRTSPPALRTRDWRSFRRFLRRFIVRLDGRSWAIGCCTPRPGVGFARAAVGPAWGAPTGTAVVSGGRRRRTAPPRG